MMLPHVHGIERYNIKIMLNLSQNNIEIECNLNKYSNRGFHETGWFDSKMIHNSQSITLILSKKPKIWTFPYCILRLMT